MSGHVNRRFWQIHLSTVLAATLLTSTLLYINIQFIVDGSTFRLGVPIQTDGFMTDPDGILELAEIHPMVAVVNLALNFAVILVTIIVLELVIRKQIHRSTFIILLIITGVLVWANMTPWRVWTFSDQYARWSAYGWPVPIDWCDDFIGGDDSSILRKRYGDHRVILNLIANAGILVAATFILEWRIRRSLSCRRDLTELDEGGKKYDCQ